jgi:hypothetical protein
MTRVALEAILKELEQKHGILHLDSVSVSNKERLVIGKLEKEKLNVLCFFLRGLSHRVGFK